MIVFWTFVYLSSFSAVVMLVLQVQHFGLYPLVGKERFAALCRREQSSRRLFPAIFAARVLDLRGARSNGPDPLCFFSAGRHSSRRRKPPPVLCLTLRIPPRRLSGRGEYMPDSPAPVTTAIA